MSIVKVNFLFHIQVQARNMHELSNLLRSLPNLVKPPEMWQQTTDSSTLNAMAPARFPASLATVKHSIADVAQKFPTFVMLPHSSCTSELQPASPAVARARS